ncbi:TPA: hypothetical protein N0F65_012570 [Lagenidium giganteum]|uniref:WW domain-containing protein n=1 Tax=Lagenidium giganteum TaxID=4803 RepID=A0AAV2YS93_9STRA|nr:TPA: hypothetical protein N0F65_012570 [Lagenidium giganteum]
MEEPRDIWQKVWDPTSQAFYYFNPRLQQSTWELPQGFVYDDTDGGDDDNAKVQEMAAVKVQSIARGRATRNKMSGKFQWVRQFDPVERKTYYYNTITHHSQFERPPDFVPGIRDVQSDRAVKIQSAFRSKQARAKVKQLHGNKPKPPESPVPREVWSSHFDPRSHTFYYVNNETGEMSWVKPEGSQLSLTSDKRSASATTIQCAIRKRLASKNVEETRGQIRTMTDPVVIDGKLADITAVLAETQAAIIERALTAQEKNDFPHLREPISSWETTCDMLQDNLRDLVGHASYVKEMQQPKEKICEAKKLHNALTDLHSQGVTLHHSILIMNSYFVEVDVQRLNRACAALARWKSHEICSLKDANMLKVVHSEDFNEIFGRAEVLFRRAMGLTDFTQGETTSAGKKYEEWHNEVKDAVEGLNQVERLMQHKLQLLNAFRTAQEERREQALMEKEEQRSVRAEKARQRLAHETEAHVRFLEMCQEYWSRGLRERQEDLRTAALLENEQIEQLARERERIDRLVQRDKNRRKKMKLSIWEAVKEGLSVEIVRTMVFAEMQKARQLGYDFLVRNARSEHGETLVQIACWWGHVELVEYLLDQGGDLLAVDSLCNRYTLLHDAARRGHVQVIRLLLERGLRHDVVDSCGDTPLHWAARRGQYDAVQMLLGGHLQRCDQKMIDVIMKSVRARNNRNRTPKQVTKSECIRRLIQAFDDGKLPLFQPVKPSQHASNRRQTELPRRNSHRQADPRPGKSFSVVKSGAALLHSSEAPLTIMAANEDEFGVINVVTSRDLVSPMRKRRSFMA